MLLILSIAVQAAEPPRCPVGTQSITSTAENGRVWAGCQRADGVRHGPFVWSEADGTLLVSGALVDGREHGTAETWAPQGFRLVSGAMEAGKREGEWRTWHAAEKPRSVVSYRDGLRHGSAQVWDAHGVLLESGEHADGLRTGPWHILTPGRLETAEFDAGRRHGLSVVEEGEYRTEQTWEAGVLSGPVRYYHEGLIIFEGRHEAGAQVGESRRWAYHEGRMVVEERLQGGHVVERIEHTEAP